ncbi:MAG: 2-amino-4-hydroxy-6-hydroxymethyldihydropteridine diphosphokinase [Synechococcales cyanobacterium RM1_1_8]|nr:2-amino-4-hydroxy-6-hydroxymethyldihydropteridine diphosphokinase [Synechococcales cyanobacterium RM1_1_8]
MIQPRVKAAIALGSNLGKSQQILQRALAQLSVVDGLVLKQISSFYHTRPIGPPQPDYVNACALLETQLSPLALLHCLQTVEQAFDRLRVERWGPRTLDLDLLLWGNQIIDQPDLQVPHPRMAERGFVLVPLAEVFAEAAQDWRHPVLGVAIADLLQP